METGGSRARVSAALRGFCGTCSEGGSCHLHLSAAPDRTEVVTAQNDAGAKRGDTVELDLLGHAELRLSLLVWAVPLAGIVGGAVAGVLLAGLVGLAEDPAALGGAALGFGVSMLILRKLDRHAAANGRLLPHIVRIVDTAACPGRGKA